MSIKELVLQMNIKSFFSIKAAALIAIAFLSISAQAKDNKQSFTAKDLVDINTFPEWFIDSMAREKTVKKKSKLKLEKFNVNKKIIGKVKLIEQEDNYWFYNIDIGTDSPVECYVFEVFDGPANSLYAIVDSVLTEGIKNLYKQSLSNKFNYAVGSGVFESTPYLLLAETDNSLQICIHNEVGYRETFYSVFKSFVGAIAESEKNTEFFETIVQMTLNGIPVGYSLEKYTTDDDGDVKQSVESSLLLPVDASSVSRSDSESTSWSRTDGSLINGSIYSIENSVLSSNLSIQAEDGKWQVVGGFQGKDVKYQLDYTGGLLSGYGFYAGTADLSKSDQSSVDYHMWMPEVDPSSALKITISKVLGNPDANFKLTLGPLVMKVLAEDDGVFRKGTLEQGPLKMNFETVYLKGAPSL